MTPSHRVGAVRPYSARLTQDLIAIVTRRQLNDLPIPTDLVLELNRRGLEVSDI